MKITAHCIVKNEDCWVYFAIKSILSFVEHVIVYDTGSTDHTVEILKDLKSQNPKKITFEEKGPVDRVGLSKLREEQVKRTKTDWFLILDGDEIWKKEEIQKLISETEKKESQIIAAFNRTRNCIGDVYHYLPYESGGYEIAGIKGTLNIRLIKNKPNLLLTGEYPWESYADENGPIEKQSKNLLFVDCWYLHTSFLKRSSKDVSKSSGSFGKKKFPEKGIRMSDQELPDVLLEHRPSNVPDPLTKRSRPYEYIASISSPLIKIKRKIK